MIDKKIALVTGGGSGIGQATAVLLAKNGYQVVIVGRTKKNLEQTCALHENIDYFVTDICDDHQVKNLFDEISNKYGRLDVLVNNAGIAPVASFDDMSMDVFDDIFKLNVRALVLVTKMAISLLKETKGNVVNVISGLVSNPQPFISAYTASKAAVESLTKSLAKEYAPFGVRFNAVAAGATDTPLYDKAGQTPEEEKAYKEAVTSVIPLKRFAKADEIAKVIAFISSDDAIYATGSVYAIDGGFGL